MTYSGMLLPGYQTVVLKDSKSFFELNDLQLYVTARTSNCCVER